MSEHLKGLNSAQREAAVHVKGPLLIVAGAGAGKTKTITHRIINLIKKGVAPEKILAVTFTNKAAKEMKERIISEIEKSAKGQNSIPFVSTFHSLGVYIIKENAKILGLTKYFTILDEGDTTTLIKETLKEIGLDPKQYDPRKIKNIISREKGNFKHYEEYQEEKNNSSAGGANYLSKIVAQVWKIYESKKAKENSLDFDDLLLKSTKLLKENEEIRKKYQEKWEYMHVDEYQDTNEAQYLMSRLLSEKNKNICVVGDADQNIYSWRGANLKNILSFEKDYPNAKIILLEENYRSTKNILEAANEVIKKNKYRPDKNLFTKNKIGEKISIYEALDESDEAEFVAKKILKIFDCFESSNFSSLRPSQSTEWDPRDQKIERFSALKERQDIVERTLGRSDGDGQRKFSAENFRGESYNILPEIAILYRANFQSRILEEAMLKYNIPYQVLGIKFFERKEIKDTLAYLRSALNPESLSDIKRIINFPVRGIG
ncbi:MAG: UvrD-helicase domain-containing protein, partial [Patescibacteria group bacterium]